MRGVLQSKVEPVEPVEPFPGNRKECMREAANWKPLHCLHCLHWAPSGASPRPPTRAELCTAQSVLARVAHGEVPAVALPVLRQLARMVVEPLDAAIAEADRTREDVTNVE